MNLIMEAKYYRSVNGALDINKPSIHTATNNLVRTVGKQNLSELIGLGGIRVDGLRKAILASGRL